MSILSTILIYAIIPIAVLVVVGALAFGGSRSPGPSRRYRPGRPYDFQPIWFLASPEQVGPALGGPEPQRAPAIEAGIMEDSAGVRVLPGPTGGASDRW